MRIKHITYGTILYSFLIGILAIVLIRGAHAGKTISFFSMSLIIITFLLGLVLSIFAQIKTKEFGNLNKFGLNMFFYGSLSIFLVIFGGIFSSIGELTMLLEMFTWMAILPMPLLIFLIYIILVLIDYRKLVGEEIVSYECEFCGKKFSSLQVAEKHEKKCNR